VTRSMRHCSTPSGYSVRSNLYGTAAR
jgi:hypothetical protein